jgi:hypothetical protein
MYIERHADLQKAAWQQVLQILRHRLADVLSECQVREKQHDDFLANQTDDLLAKHTAELRDDVDRAEAIMTEVQAVRQREAAGLEMLRRVWQGTQRMKRYVYRQGLPMGEVDRLLAQKWAHNFGASDYWISAMESARCAELVALGIYRELYGNVEDLSILQRTAPSDTRWQAADIDAVGRWVDVKNAHRSFSSRKSYSEHRVKCLKSDRLNRDVAVSGFLSMYIADGEVGSGEQVVWLGETTLGIIESLRSKFETHYLQLDFSGQSAIRIPPWLFEYPPECYAERDAALASVRSRGFILPRSACPLGLLVLADRIARPLPRDLLSEESLALSRRLLPGATPTRPVLFLHVLDRFCRTTLDGVPFPLNELRQILSSEECDKATPLGVLDPLETVNELLDVLGSVAECCAQHAVAFTSFRMTGAGIFQGRRNGGKWQTIFAYCGGWRRSPNVKCGQSPLFMGKNDQCACGKLVCHTCGYCDKDCPQCSPRQEGWPTRPHHADHGDESSARPCG